MVHQYRGDGVRASGYTGNMDPISQAAIGAAAAQSGAPSTPLRTGLWMGAIGGAMPDIDVLIRSPADPLLFLEYHRHFTHALAFIPFGGLAAAAVGSLLTRGRHRIRDLWLPATLGWATHGLLDSCTSYGTFLLWPFSGERIAWHSVAIIDPLLTLPLVAGVLLAWRRGNRILARLALGWALAYLCFGVVQRDRAASAQQRLIEERGHTALRSEVKPSIGNNFLFRAFYEHDGRYWADAIRVPWFGPTKIYEGESIPVLTVAELIADLPAIHARDVQRFAFFSNNFLVNDPRHPGFVSDFRYAALPNRVAPLWGIDLGGAEADRHLQFERFNRVSAPDRAEFMRQLKGE